MKPESRNVRTKLYAVAALACTLVVAAILNAAATDPAPPTGIKNVVLVHGAFADGSGWEAVECRCHTSVVIPRFNLPHRCAAHTCNRESLTPRASS